MVNGTTPKKSFTSISKAETLPLPGASTVGRSPGADDGRPEKGGQKMLEIKIIKKDGDVIYTRINAELEVTARYYFSAAFPDVERIDILAGGTFENEFYKKTPLQIFRANPEEVETFELFHNIRLMYKVDYKEPLPDGTTQIINSCGLCTV